MFIKLNSVDLADLFGFVVFNSILPHEPVGAAWH